MVIIYTLNIEFACLVRPSLGLAHYYIIEYWLEIFILGLVKKPIMTKSLEINCCPHNHFASVINTIISETVPIKGK